MKFSSKHKFYFRPGDLYLTIKLTECESTLLIPSNVDTFTGYFPAGTFPLIVAWIKVELIHSVFGHREPMVT